MATRTTTISFTDEKGLPAGIEYSTPDAAGIITTAELAEEIATALSELVDGIITGINIVTNVPLPGGLVGMTGNAGSDVEEGALFTFRTSGNHPTKMRIPTFSELFFLAGTKQVDIADDAVDAFLDLMINGRTDVVNGNVAPCDQRGEDITTLSSAVEKFKPRKGG